MLTLSRQQERNMQYPGTSKSEKVTSRLGTFPSLRNGCLPSSRLKPDGCLSSSSLDAGKTASAFLVEPTVLEQRTSPEPDLAPPALPKPGSSSSSVRVLKLSRHYHNRHRHRNHHSKREKEPPLPATVRQAHPDRKTIPTLAPKVRDPPPPTEVRRSNPHINTVPVLTPRVRREPPPPHAAPAPAPDRSKRGRRRKREEEHAEDEAKRKTKASAEQPHYTVVQDESKPFLLRLKLNRTVPTATTNPQKTSKNTPQKVEKKWREAPTEEEEVVVPRKRSTDTVTERKDSKRSASGKKSTCKKTTPPPLPPLLVKNSRSLKEPGPEPQPRSPKWPSLTHNKLKASSGGGHNIKFPTPAERINGDDFTKAKARRKRGGSRVEESRDAFPCDPLSEEAARPAITKGPRIKTLQEILDSLNIKLDDDLPRPLLCDGLESNQGAASKMATNGYRERNKGAEQQPTRKRTQNRATTRDKVPPPTTKATGDIGEGEGAGGVGGCQSGGKAESGRSHASDENHEQDANKKIKVIISGEVSRRPTKAPTCCASSNAFNNSNQRVSEAAKEERDDSGDDDDQDDEQESDSDSNDRKTMQKERKKRVKTMAKKHEAKDRDELKEILKARCAYRRDIPADDVAQEDGASEESEGNKTREGDANAAAAPAAAATTAASESTKKARPLGITSPRDTDSQDDEGNRAKAEKRSKGDLTCTSSRLQEEEEEENEDASDSPAHKSVEEILAQLPPLPPSAAMWDDLLWREDEEDGRLPASRALQPSPRALQRLVQRMSTEQVEGLTGNASLEGGGDKAHGGRRFREWHEAAVRRTRDGQALVLLPYVVID